MDDDILKILKRQHFNINLDSDIYLAIKRNPSFNVSKFVNEMLREALKVEKIIISKDKETLEHDVQELKMKILLSEQKLKEIQDAEEKEKTRYISREEALKRGLIKEYDVY